MFILDSFGHQLSIQTQLSDVKVKQISISKRGTRVIFEVSVQSKLHLNDVFKKFTNLTDNSNFGFDKTEIRVNLRNLPI